MNVLRRIVVGLAGVVVVALALELLAPKAVHAVVSTLVTVSNTTAQPVPTMAVDTRNVNVVNTPTVTATISGTPSVNVNSLPAVQLSGTPSVNIASPLSIGGNVNATVSNPAGATGAVPLVTDEVNNPAYQPASIELYMTNGASTSATVPSTLPSGGAFRELVINWVSGFCANGGLTTNPASSVALQTDASQISIISAASTNGTIGFYGIKTALYAGPGSTITLTALGTAGTFQYQESPETVNVSPAPRWACLINADGYYVTQ
jgi:hypothetical protein